MQTGTYCKCKKCGRLGLKGNMEVHGRNGSFPAHYHRGCWRKIQIAKALADYRPTFGEKIKWWITRRPIEVKIAI